MSHSGPKYSTILALLSVFACHSRGSVALDEAGTVPAEVAWIAVLERGASGDVEGTPLVHRGSGQRIIYARNDRPVALIGYTEGQLQSERPMGTDPSIIESIPLSEAKGCARHLPKPYWTSGLSAGGKLIGLPVDLDPVPALSAAWVAPKCPLTITASAAMLTCGNIHCRATPVIGNDCAFSLVADADACPDHPFSIGTVLPEGDICTEHGVSPPSTCWSGGGPDGASLRFAVGNAKECCAGFYLEHRSWEADLARVRVIDTEPKIPIFEGQPLEKRLLSYSAARLLAPYRELVVLPDRVVVFDAKDCEGPTDIYFLDLETLAFIGPPIQGPRCLSLAVGDPFRPGFLGTYLDQGTFRLGRFDPSARLGDSIPLFSGVADGVELAPFELIALPGSDSDPNEPPYVALLSGSRPPRTELQRLSVIDTRMLEILTTFTGDQVGLQTYPIAAIESDLIAGLDPVGHKMLFFSARAGARHTPVARNFSEASQPIRAMHILYHAHSQALLIAAAGQYQGINQTSPFDVLSPIEHRPFLEGGDGPLLTGSWLADNRTLAMVGLISWPSGSPPEARIAIYDPTGKRYLPGSVHVGFGAIGRIRDGDRNRVWILLPWSGEVVRVSPRVP